MFNWQESSLGGVGGAASAHMSHNMSGLRPQLLSRHWLIATGPRAISARIFYSDCIIVLSAHGMVLK